MAVRLLPGVLAGASLFALASAAQAQSEPMAGMQDHSGMTMPMPDPALAPAPTRPASPRDPDTMTGMPRMADMAGMDHGTHTMPMTSALGPWPMTRDGSGTSWQPDLSEHAGIHSQHGEWSVMTHALLNLTYDSQSGPRGRDKTFVSGMVMAMARRQFTDGSILNLRAMVSPDPFMGKDGYPLLLAAGETADGINTLVDRQHPHDLFMELSASYARPISAKDSVFAYVGLPGEPAFGPPAFMHRMSAMDSPEAPITHHWLDSTHIVFGVATLGWVHDAFKLEASSFKGREPDQHRFDIEEPRFDSWAVRGSWNPTPAWSLQVSYADVAAPEQLNPDAPETKVSVSAIHTRRVGADGWWSTTLAWGRKTVDHEASKDGWLLETALHPDDRWTVFARAERIETDELVAILGDGHGPVQTVGKASIGAIRDWRIADHARFGVGALASINAVPDGLASVYGDRPTGTMVFVRLKID
ncbi:hypothetical protein BH10PSE2_BH10PSE2_08170 [soil metagenome]